MLQYLQNMARKDPGTFVVMVLLVLILAFGIWDSWPTPKPPR